MRFLLVLTVILLQLGCGKYYEKHLSIDSGGGPVEVDFACSYEIGFLFYDDNDGLDVINVFGSSMDPRLPLVVNIFIYDSKGSLLFEKIEFGGQRLGYRYGPNPIKFVAGSLYLEAGTYTVKFNVEEAYFDLSDFESSFFISKIPNSKCVKYSGRKL